jgi:hypothetical protein
MATINVVASVDSETPITETELDGGDTLPAGTTGTLFIRNDSGLADVINLLGDNVISPVVCTGVGEVVTSGGYDIDVADGELVPVKLAEISNFLKADTVINVTGGAASVFAYVIK